MNETDEEIDTTAIEEEEWIDYMKRSTDEAIEQMKKTNIRCWIKADKRMKWRLALRIASLLGKRWIVKAAEWKPELSSKYKTYRPVGRPRRRCEDEINEFLKLEEAEMSTESDTKCNGSCFCSKRPRKMDDTRKTIIQ